MKANERKWVMDLLVGLGFTPSACPDVPEDAPFDAQLAAEEMRAYERFAVYALRAAERRGEERVLRYMNARSGISRFLAAEYRKARRARVGRGRK